MNKEYEKFHRDNASIIENLLESLSVLIDKFENEIVPGEPEKSDALHMLDVYKDAIEIFGKVEAPAFKRIQSESGSFDEETFYHELTDMKDTFSLLLKLCREKLLEKEDPCFDTKAGRILLQNNYCDEVIIDNSGKHYYSLSTKAEKIIKSKSLISRIRNEKATAVIPNSLILSADKWTNLYARRVEFLQQYYSKKKPGIEYILFTLDDEKEMVFGCELGDAVDVTYTFAGVFDEKIDKHIVQLKRLASSELIDHLVVVIDSEQMAGILAEDGVDDEHTSYILIDKI